MSTMDDKGKYLAIFDFDNVLYLWDARPEQKAQYETKLRCWLQSLRDDGICLCIVSCGANVTDLSKSIGIFHFFDHILSDNSSYNKKPMLKRIFKLFPDVPKERMVFYDDCYDNIIDAESLGIRSFCIGRKTGLSCSKSPFTVTKVARIDKEISVIEK